MFDKYIVSGGDYKIPREILDEFIERLIDELNIINCIDDKNIREMGLTSVIFRLRKGSNNE